MRAVIYSRVPDWTQAGAGAARAAQLAWCEAKAAEIGAGVVGRFDDHDGAGCHPERRRDPRVVALLRGAGRPALHAQHSRAQGRARVITPA